MKKTLAVINTVVIAATIAFNSGRVPLKVGII
jgi:hypothetical protein